MSLPFNHRYLQISLGAAALLSLNKYTVLSELSLMIFLIEKNIKENILNDRPYFSC